MRESRIQRQGQVQFVASALRQGKAPYFGWLISGVTIE